MSSSFPDTGIGRQLKQVARLIKFVKMKNAEDPNFLDVQRQVFCCVLGGFDTHSYQLPTHASLLGQLGGAMRSFYDCVKDEIQLSNKVTTFTMSDFGRTFDASGEGPSIGSDHGWASHQLVFGGAVEGGNFYGRNATNGLFPFPKLACGSDDDSESAQNGGRGRWIPSTSIDQYAATLARWFGVTESELDCIFPNLANFNPHRDLGFMT